MTDMTSDSSGINYGKKDASSDRLWLTQRSKANPWEHRGTRTDTEDQPGTSDAAPAQAEPSEPKAITMIAQHDSLKLQEAGPTELFNPFERLIAHSSSKRPRASSLNTP